MAPFVHETLEDNSVSITDVKSHVILKHIEVKPDAKPPVADDFMYDFQYNHELPTTTPFRA